MNKKFKTLTAVRKPKSTSDFFNLNNIIRIFTFVTSLIVFAKIYIYKRKHKPQNPQPISKISFRLTGENHMLSDITTNTITAICFAMIGIIQIQINIVDIRNMKLYPLYLFEYFYYLIRGPVMFLLLVLILYIRDDVLRNTILREIKYQLGLFFNQNSNPLYCINT